MTNAIFRPDGRILRARDDNLAGGMRFRRFKRAERSKSPLEGDDAPRATISAEDWMDEVRAQTEDAIGGRRRGPAKRPAPVRQTQSAKRQPVPNVDDTYLLPEPVSAPYVQNFAPEPVETDDHYRQRYDVWSQLPIVRSNLSPELLGQSSGLSKTLRDDPAARGFDLLRTRLLRTLKTKGWRRVAVAAPTKGCGSSFAAVNLALSLARVPHSRTVLMDLHQRDPSIARMIGVRSRADIHYFLRGRLATADFFCRLTDQLAVGLSEHPYPDAADLLHNPICEQALQRMDEELAPDVVVYDLPPILAHDDLAAFLPQVDGVLLVSDGTRTTARHISQCERILRGQTELLGIILNKSRKSDAAASVS